MTNLIPNLISLFVGVILVLASRWLCRDPYDRPI